MIDAGKPAPAPVPFHERNGFLLTGGQYLRLFMSERAAAGVPARSAPLGTWSALVLAGWFTAGMLVFTSGGERCAVRVLCRFRGPSRGEREFIGSVLNGVLDRDGIAPGSVDLYVRVGAGINAFATGGRNIAITRAAAAGVRAGDVTNDVLAAILSHEIGHLARGDTHWALATAWLAAPWRVTYRFGPRLAAPLARHQPRAPLALVITAGTVVASYQADEQSHCAAAVLLCALAVCSVVVPVADAALGRSSEYASDAHAARTGYAAHLAAALRSAAPDTVGRPSFLCDHPPVARRLRRLARAAGSEHPPGAQ